MSMCRLIAISNRGLCDDDFFERIYEISVRGVRVILREKDLNESEYELLAKRTLERCPNIILHTYVNTARKLGRDAIHLPMPVLRKSDISDFKTVGASVHSAAEAREAQEMGASYVIFGNVYQTDCKKGLAPKGLEKLREVCSAVKIPVYAIGGLTPERTKEVMRSGAYGVCAMSGFMQCPNIGEYIDEYTSAILSSEAQF